MGRVLFGQASEGLVQVEDLLRHRVERELVSRQRNPCPPAAALDRSLGAGTVDEDAAHRLGCGREEVAVVLPLAPGPIVTQQPQVRLVNQCRRLERLARRLPGHPMLGQRAKLVVDDGQELLGGPFITAFHRLQDPGDVSAHHCMILTSETLLLPQMPTCSPKEPSEASASCLLLPA